MTGFGPMRFQDEIEFSQEELTELGIEARGGNRVITPRPNGAREGLTGALVTTVRQPPFSPTDLIVEAAFERLPNPIAKAVVRSPAVEMPSVIIEPSALLPSTAPSPWDADEDPPSAGDELPISDTRRLHVQGEGRGDEEDLPSGRTVISTIPPAFDRRLDPARPPLPGPLAAGPAIAPLPAPAPALADDDSVVISSSPAPGVSGPKVTVADEVSGRVSPTGRASIEIVPPQAVASPIAVDRTARSLLAYERDLEREPEIEPDEEELGGPELDLEELHSPMAAPTVIGPPPTPPEIPIEERRSLAPPPAIPPPSPSAPPPTPATVQARFAVAPPPTAAPPPLRSFTATPPPMPLPLAASTAGASPDKIRRKRRQKQWFEEIFDEDYLCTLPFMTPRQTERESTFILDALRIQSPATLLDLGCGYGRHAMELASRGHRVTGLDLSLPLLIRAADAARRDGVNVNFIHCDMREMTFDAEFDAAFCYFTTFGYFDDDSNRKVAQQIARALKPGGRLLLDVINRDYLIGDLPTRVWWQGEGCVVLEEVDFNYFTSRLQVHRSIVFEDGRQTEHEISIRAYSLHEIGKVLHHAGFRVIEVSGGLALRGRFFGPEARQILIVAEKKEPSAP